MDIDRPHFRTTSTGSTTAAATTSELFICFTSRLSSSSMKLSKSILSPGRAARDGGPTALSSSLSRRLRTSGSLKGGQASPFFNTTGKKRGCAFENPEPSSPKVTCIGQVRVKTKKKVKQGRSLSKRQSGGGEVSFRKIEPQSCADGDDKAQQQQRYSNTGPQFQPPPQECLPHRNQRWVHFPVSICETLRTFSAEFSCLFPCRSSCFSTSVREKREKQNGDDNGCGAVFARWLVSVNDGEGGKRREIELVVGGGDEEEEEERVSLRTSRRHVFEDIEVKDDKIELKGKSLEREEEAARVSICIPPKNALLLMRCRSDPMKMAALVNNRFTWNPAAAAENENEDIQEKEENMDDAKDEEVHPSGDANEVKEIINEIEEGFQIEEDEEAIGEEELEKINSDEMAEEKTELEMLVLEEEEEEEAEELVGSEEEEVESNMSSFEALLDKENTEQYEDCCPVQDEENSPVCHLSSSPEPVEEDILIEAPPPLLQESEAAHEEENNEETSTTTAEEEEEQEEEEEEEEEELATATATATAEENQESATSFNEDEDKEEKEGPLLPECLLLMMCEPKLSMEVSKETWVCRTDFMRWLPERPRKPVKSAKHDHHDSKSKPIVDRSHLQQPPRSSCSLPPAAAAASMATMIEHKLVNAVAYEPFVLTRCKSEPMRTAAAKLMPDSCFWRNAVRKLEPHRCDAVGVGAAGVGF